MDTKYKLIFVLAAAIPVLAGTGLAQDSPSLGDLARRQRLEKERSKAAPGSEAKASKVITNEEIPERAAPLSANPRSESGTAVPAPSGGAKQSPEQWKSQILAEKSQIASLQKQIEQLQESIRFAPPNCVGRCVEWNERQKEKMQQVEGMQSQLDEQKKRLEEMQDSAQKQGYGSSVYEP